MRGRRELQGIGVALALLVGGDLAVSRVATRVTVDAQHVDQIPALLSPLAGEGPPSVLFVGNSITRRGIDVDLFAGLAPEPAGTRAAAVHPDDTTIADWPFLYDHFVESRGIAPDVVVVPFATGQLRDDRPLDAGRIGGDYTAFDELASRVDEVGGLSNRVELVGAYASATFANRERLARRFFDLIPSYRELAQDINDAGVESRDAELDGVEVGYERLAGLSAAVARGGGRLIVVAMPTQFEYSLDATLLQAARDFGVEVVDFRGIGLGADGFRDELHLSERGAKVVTTALSEAVWAVA